MFQKAFILGLLKVEIVYPKERFLLTYTSDSLPSEPNLTFTSEPNITITKLKGGPSDLGTVLKNHPYAPKAF